MAFEPGKLRHRVTLQRNDETQDTTTGAMLPAWVDVASVWASVEPLSGREFVAAQAVQSNVSVRIVVRYRADITPAMRIIHAGRVHNIAGVLADKDSGREYLTLMCDQGVNDG